MNTHAFLGMVVGLGFASDSIAQNTAVLWWEVNDGNGWQSGDITTSNTALSVRRMASWSAPSGSIFGGTLFDAIVTTVNGTADSVSNMRITSEFNYTQGLSAFRFGNVIKIDQTLDSEAPGVGSRWINPYNEPTQADPNRNNPVELMRFSIDFTLGLYGVRTVSEVHGLLPTNGANTTDRVLWLFLDQTTLDLPVTTRLDARINYIPSPGSLAMLSGLVGIAARRRR